MALGDEGGGIRLWEVSTMEKILQRAGHPHGVVRLKFSPDGRWLLSRGGAKHVPPGPLGFRREDVGYFHLWDLASGDPILTLRADPGYRSEEWTTDAQGKRVLIQRPDPKRLAKDVAFFSDGRILASACLDNQVHLWEVASGSVIASLSGHQDVVNTVAVSPDSRALASGSDDHTILVWDLGPILFPSEPAGEPPGNERLEVLWEALARKDGLAAYEAMRVMSAWRETTLPFLKARLPRAPKECPQALHRKAEDLDDDDFDVRERAQGELAKAGVRAIPALVKAHRDSPSPEGRHRAQDLLQALEMPFQSFPSDPLRSVRAIQILEWLDGEGARAILKDCASGHPHALQTCEAKAALERLEGRGGQ